MIIFIQNQLPHYRRAFFNRLCDLGPVLVIHSGRPAVRAEDRFQEAIVPMRRVGPFNLQRGLAALIHRHKPTAVIASLDLRNLTSIATMLRFERRLKWIWWGLDEGASKLALVIKTWIARRGHPVVFYNRSIHDAFVARGLDGKRLFVANNTFHVENHRSFHDEASKDCFINVGTLDPRKDNAATIRTFKAILEKTRQDLRLYLIGEGSDRAALETLIRDLGLEGQVILTGKIEDPAELERFYARALASVSYGQAGLAVLQSMAFGVPFVTKADAISGGEKHNIVDGENGIFCDEDIRSLERAMLSLAEDRDRARTLGRNAYTHYIERASIDGMVDGFKVALASGRN